MRPFRLLRTRSASHANTCRLNQFGDWDFCTEIATQAISVKLTRLRLADRSGRGRRKYGVSGELQPAGATYFLVIPRRRSGPHRLIVDLGDDHRQVVTMESVPASPAGKPELCSNAKCEAFQFDGRVEIRATGAHPSAGWQEVFEQLPIRIFPPLYRLVCFPPTGVVAQVITLFETSTSFSSDSPVTSVMVHDSRGRHKVPVQMK